MPQKPKRARSSFNITDILRLIVSCQQRRPRIVSAPRHPLTVNSKDNATFDWLFELRPTETWTNSIYELIFGIWKYPGFLKTKLMVIDKHGGVLIRPNYERKISCSFNMSRLQVAFTLHNSSTEDEKQYGLHVEFGLARSPLTDTVMLRLQGKTHFTKKIIRLELPTARHHPHQPLTRNSRSFGGYQWE